MLTAVINFDEVNNSVEFMVCVLLNGKRILIDSS